jgi:SAM-dependent methyltransferase
MTTTTERAQRPDTETTGTSEAFAERLVGLLDGACTVLMASIGHQTGLFETLGSLDAPGTSAEVAAAAGLDERYVREWLAAMTTSRIVEHDPATQTFRLSPEHAACLTLAAGPDNLARFAQYLPLIAEVEQPIIECFRNGGGLSYAAYPRFHRIMGEDSAAVFDVALVDAIVPIVPGLTERLESGIDVADIGCGQGHAVTILARAFPRSRFTGYDFSEEAIATARAEASSWALDNARFEVQDVAALDVHGGFDLVTAFDTVHDQAHPAEVLRRIHHGLRSGGTFLMVDMLASSNLEDNVDHPLGTFLYTVSTMHCMSVSLGLGGAGLGTAWGRQLAESMLGDAGFTSVVVNEVEADPFNYYYVATRD